MNYFMTRNACSAECTLKGRFFCRVKKCLFSVTRMSALTHSAYAAIKASAGFNPREWYFSPSSNGIRKSSSIVVKPLRSKISSLNALGDTLSRTSSTIRRVMRSLCAGFFRKRRMNCSQVSLLEMPKAKIYSFASRTKTKFFSPQLLARLAHMLNDFVCGHPFKRGWSPFNNFPDFIKVFPCFFSRLRDSFLIVVFQGLSPFIKTIAYPYAVFKGNVAHEKYC